MTTSADSPQVSIDGDRITDGDTFHTVFAEAFGFPDFYGRNMDAWIDCLTYLDADDGLSTALVQPGQVLNLEIWSADSLAARCPEIYIALLECTEFVDHRRTESGQPAVLSLRLIRDERP